MEKPLKLSLDEQPWNWAWACLYKNIYNIEEFIGSWWRCVCVMTKHANIITNYWQSISICIWWKKSNLPNTKTKYSIDAMKADKRDNVWTHWTRNANNVNKKNKTANEYSIDLHWRHISFCELVYKSRYKQYAHTHTHTKEAAETAIQSIRRKRRKVFCCLFSCFVSSVCFGSSIFVIHVFIAVWHCVCAYELNAGG